MNKINDFTEKNIAKILETNKQPISKFSLLFVGLAIISLIFSIINIETSLLGFVICIIYVVYNRVKSKNTGNNSSLNSDSLCIVNVYCIGGNELIKVFGNNENNIQIKLVELKCNFSKLYGGKDIKIGNPYHVVFKQEGSIPMMIFEGHYSGNKYKNFSI